MKTIVLLLSIFALNLSATELEGASFTETANVGRASLSLNGVGLRTATVFKVKVYAAGLYLTQKSTDPKVILASSWPMQLQMEFFRDVESKSIQEAWEKTFKENCELKCDAFKTAFNELVSFMPSVKKKDRMVYTFQESGIDVTLNGKKMGSVAGAEFSRFILSTWLGEHPPTEKLKKGLLGLTD